MIVVFPLSIRHTSEPVERHSLTTIVFQLTSEQSHVEWRKTLQKEKCVQELKLYIGVHKLSLTDTQIIGFIDQKLPEVTHINHYEALLQSKLSAAEWIRCVLGIRAYKSEAIDADIMMQKLLPPWPDGE